MAASQGSTSGVPEWAVLTKGEHRNLYRAERPNKRWLRSEECLLNF